MDHLRPGQQRVIFDHITIGATRYEVPSPEAWVKDIPRQPEHTEPMCAIMKGDEPVKIVTRKYMEDSIEALYDWLPVLHVLDYHRKRIRIWGVDERLPWMPVAVVDMSEEDKVVEAQAGETECELVVGETAQALVKEETAWGQAVKVTEREQVVQQKSQTPKRPLPDWPNPPMMSRARLEELMVERRRVVEKTAREPAKEEIAKEPAKEQPAQEPPRPKMTRARLEELLAEYGSKYPRP